VLACDVPVVAQIAGNCMGAGVEIASCCDIRLSAESAQYGAPIARLGFPMAPREAALVAGAVGDMTVRQMLLEATVFSAPEMLKRGFLSKVVADVDLPSMALATVQRIGQLAPQAARLNKQTLRALNTALSLTNKAQEAMTNSVATDALQQLLATAYDYASSHEQCEGIHAFLEKRAPKF
jgi:enoyl-CoA hydratase/carnithine racemase